MENTQMVKCWFCAEEILSDAKKCKHCGEWVRNEKKQLSNISTDKNSLNQISVKSNSINVSNKFSRQRLGIAFLSIVGMSATFMPWVKIPILGTLNGTKGDGWITFSLFIIPLLLSFVNDKTKPLGRGLIYSSIIPSILASGIGLLKILEFNSVINNMDNDNPFSSVLNASVSIEFGLYLVVFIGVLITLFPIIVKD